MQRMAWWFVDNELRLWNDAERKLALWWRDDDARNPTPALSRLLELSKRHNAPLALATVPDGDPDAVAAALGPLNCLLQHGVTHADRSGGRSPPFEFGPEDPVVGVADTIETGAARLALTGRFVRLFVPPWNRINPNLTAALAQTGFVGVSGFGEFCQPGEVVRLDTHIDLLRWKGGARFRGAWRILMRLRRMAKERRLAEAWDEPIGFLTHHLDHDEASWRFLDSFLGEIGRRNAIEIVDVREAIGLETD